MKKITILILIITVTISCNKYTALNNTALTNYQAANYSETFNSLDQAISEDISKGKTVDPNAYLLAGKAANKLNHAEKSSRYLIKAYQQGVYDQESLIMLADHYLAIDNLSKEMSVLELYKNKFPEGQQRELINEKLFCTYVKSENWETGISLYDSLNSGTKTKINVMQGILRIYDALEMPEKAVSEATQILDKAPDNEIALFYLAKSKYWNAENTYQAEMDKYNKKKTRKQYNHLLKELKLISADFRTSRDYFLKLYQSDPKPEYAQYLGNIYARLNDEQKSAYYKNKADQ